jgi:hypothetical protein
MMADLDGHDWWHEPLVGHLFGHLYQERAGRRREDEHFILGGPKEPWLNPVRAFVLDSATARFPEMVGGKGYLVIKEPHGSVGAPLLMEALDSNDREDNRPPHRRLLRRRPASRLRIAPRMLRLKPLGRRRARFRHPRRRARS